MKKYIQKILALCAVVFAFAPVSAFAASFNNGSGDLATFTILNATRTPDSTTAWSSSVSADAGDVISLQIYYRNTSATESATRTRVFMNVPSGPASTFSLSGGVVADNAPQVTGSVNLNLSSSQTLTFIPGSFRWYPDQATPINNPLRVPPAGQSEGTLVTANGMILGNIPAAPAGNPFQFQGNVIMQFRVGNSGSGSNGPTVTTNTISTNSCTDATLTGFVNANGNANVQSFFEFSQNSSLSGANTTATQFFGNTSTNFSQFISGLNQNTTYFVRANARGTNGQTIQGGITQFTTPNCNNNNNQSLLVQTNNATNISDTFATLNGFVSGLNNQNVTVFFQYGPLGQLSNRSSSQTVSGNNSTNFAQTVSGLNPNTTYSFQAVAQGNNGQQVFGNVLTFTTGNGSNNNQSLASVTTNSASASQTACTFNGFLNSPGFGSGSAFVFFEYGTNSSFLQSRTVGQTLTSGSFSSTQSLSPNTTYFFRAAAQNNAGTAFGSVQSCVTGNGNFNNNLSVQTLPATFVAHDSALLNGSLSNGQFASASVWFEYGPALTGWFPGLPVPQNVNLPRQTFVQVLGPTSQTDFNRIVVGLSPNANYFFRAMANVNGQVVSGSVLAFTTGSAPFVPVTPSEVTPTGPIGFSKVTITKRGLNLSFPNGTNECFAARPGDTVEYTIEVHNTGAGSATNLTVRDSVSGFYDVLSTSGGAVQSGNDLSWNLGTLASGETRLLTYQLRVRPLSSNVNADNIATLSNGVSSKQSNVVHAILLNIPGGVISQVTAPTTVATTATTDTTVSTSTDSTNSFSDLFPQTALGWLGLLILVVLVALLVRALV